MTIVTTSYRPKRAPRKKGKEPAMASAIVTPAPMKKRLKRPVIRLRDQAPARANDNGGEQPKRSAIVEPKQKHSSAFGDVEDMSPEEHRRRGEGADTLWRELVRRATQQGDGT